MQRVFLVHVAPLPELGRGPAQFVVALLEVTASRNAEEDQADFVANVSHELRSPLTSLIGFIETLRNAAQDDKDRARPVSRHHGGRIAAHGARLIDDLLSLSRVEANEHVRPDGQVDLSALLAGVIDSVRCRRKRRICRSK